ncbi:MAG: hypothetical protein A4E48_01487 [Methanosaeta sp. PtaU1.Bin060]|nr:MAG: hypothetical protein A4E48_01487 [Methanosaeta sp. PtaU1.Bin060]
MDFYLLIARKKALSSGPFLEILHTPDRAILCASFNHQFISSYQTEEMPKSTWEGDDGKIDQWHPHSRAFRQRERHRRLRSRAGSLERSRISQRVALPLRFVPSSGSWQKVLCSALASVFLSCAKIPEPESFISKESCLIHGTRSVAERQAVEDGSACEGLGFRS